MIDGLNNIYSPFEQVRHQRGVASRGSGLHLADQDRQTLEQLMAAKCECVHNDIFEDADAERKLFVEPKPIDRPDTSWYHPVIDNISDGFAGKQVTSSLLTAAEEKTLFLQFNYCRYRIMVVKEHIGESDPNPEQAQQLLHWHQRAEKYREQIVQTNLALVLAMAKRTRMSEVDFSDLVSEGNMALLRAADKFDVARGFKFSTYACRAILKAFSRMGIKLSRYRQLFPTDFDPKIERSDYLQNKRAEHENDCVDEVRLIMEKNSAELNHIEHSVIEHRFGIGHRRKMDPDCKPMTLEQVGRIIGVTKERVRQIQNKALVKIRQRLEEEFLT